MTMMDVVDEMATMDDEDDVSLFAGFAVKYRQPTIPLINDVEG